MGQAWLEGGPGGDGKLLFLRVWVEEGREEVGEGAAKGDSVVLEGLGEGWGLVKGHGEGAAGKKVMEGVG